MKKQTVMIVVMGIVMLLGQAAFAHEGEHHGSKAHRAVGELKEAKAILAKMTPDTEGHVAKASQDVDQAITELSAIKPEPVKKA